MYGSGGSIQDDSLLKRIQYSFSSSTAFFFCAVELGCSVSFTKLNMIRLSKNVFTSSICLGLISMSSKLYS